MYIKVFDTRTELPLERDQNHAINLVHGVDQMKVWSYRYPYNHKNHFEKMIQDMFNEGLIQPNNNPFSSPIVLIRKKDGN